MPYQAIRDCLTPSDPNRSFVLRYWIFTLGIEIGVIATVVALCVSTPVGVAFAVLTALSVLGVLSTAPRVVTTIATAHQAAVKP